MPNSKIEVCCVDPQATGWYWHPGVDFIHSFHCKHFDFCLFFSPFLQLSWVHQSCRWPLQPVVCWLQLLLMLGLKTEMTGRPARSRIESPPFVSAHRSTWNWTSSYERRISRWYTGAAVRYPSLAVVRAEYRSKLNVKSILIRFCNLLLKSQSHVPSMITIISNLPKQIYKGKRDKIHPSKLWSNENCFHKISLLLYYLIGHGNY